MNIDEIISLSILLFNSIITVFIKLFINKHDSNNKNRHEEIKTLIDKLDKKILEKEESIKLLEEKEEAIKSLQKKDNKQ